MAQWGIGELNDEVARIRALRSTGTGLATDGERRETFGAALEQFEQLLRSAAASPPTTSPLPLFYALSQAGRAIAAARHADNDGWMIRGHGVRGPKGSYPPVLGDAVLRLDDSPRGAFKVVSQATGSPFMVDQRLQLGDLWASLPQLEVGPGLGEGSRRPIFPQRNGSEWSFETSDLESADVYRMADKYPALSLEDGPLLVTQDHPTKLGTVRGGIHEGLGRRSLADVAETHLLKAAICVRPAVDGKPPPSTLMTWWLVLFALSQLARYEPGTWARAISPDQSTLTVPIESALRYATRTLPRFVVYSLTGRWAT